MSEPYRFVERAQSAVGGRPPVRPRRVSGSDAAFRGGSRPSEMRASPVRARAAAGRTTRHRSEDGPDLTQGVAHGPFVARQYPGARVSTPPRHALIVAPSESVPPGSRAVSTYVSTPLRPAMRQLSRHPSQFPLAHGPSVPRMSECVSAPAGR